MMICTKFDLNWSTGSGNNKEGLRTGRDDTWGQSEKLISAFISDELKLTSCDVIKMTRDVLLI